MGNADRFEFELGIRDEFGLMFVKIYDQESSALQHTIESGMFPIKFHLTTGLTYLKNYKLYLVYGFTNISEDFQGFDGGIFFKAYLYGNLYAVVGLDFFDKMGSSHNLSTSNKNSFTFYCFGAGYKFSQHFNIDLIYYVPDEKAFGYDTNSYKHTYYDKINYGLIKSGFEYDISF